MVALQVVGHQRGLLCLPQAQIEWMSGNMWAPTHGEQSHQGLQPAAALRSEYPCSIFAGWGRQRGLFHCCLTPAL